jgi:hypothetical protein
MFDSCVGGIMELKRPFPRKKKKKEKAIVLRRLYTMVIR